MEEANTNPIQPDDAVPMFHAETMHCETKEHQFIIMVMPPNVDPSNFVDWLQEEIIENMKLLPSRYEVRIGEKVVLAGTTQLHRGDE